MVLRHKKLCRFYKLSFLEQNSVRGFQLNLNDKLT